MSIYDVNTGDPKKDYANMVKGLFEAASRKDMMNEFEEVASSGLLDGLPRLAYVRGPVLIGLSRNELPEAVRRDISTIRGENPDGHFNMIYSEQLVGVVIEVPDECKSPDTEEHKCIHPDYVRRLFSRAVEARHPHQSDIMVNMASGFQERHMIHCTDCD